MFGGSQWTYGADEVLVVEFTSRLSSGTRKLWGEMFLQYQLNKLWFCDFRHVTLHTVNMWWSVCSLFWKYCCWNFISQLLLKTSHLKIWLITSRITSVHLHIKYVTPISSVNKRFRHDKLFLIEIENYSLVTMMNWDSGGGSLLCSVSAECRFNCSTWIWQILFISKSATFVITLYRTRIQTE